MHIDLVNEFKRQSSVVYNLIRYVDRDIKAGSDSRPPSQQDTASNLGGETDPKAGGKTVH